MYKEDLALDNLQELIYHKSQPTTAVLLQEWLWHEGWYAIKQKKTNQICSPPTHVYTYMLHPYAYSHIELLPPTCICIIAPKYVHQGSEEFIVSHSDKQILNSNPTPKEKLVVHIYPTPPLGQDMAQGQLLNGV